MAKPVADAGSDITLTEAQLPTSVNLSGSGTDPDGGVIVNYRWTLLYKPPSSSASLSNETTATPTLNNIDVWGNYLVFLQVQDDMGEWSEFDPMLAPDSAFVTVRVTSETLGIEKPAAGERSYHERLNLWADKLENVRKDFDNHTIADHIDTAATGAQLDTLVQGDGGGTPGTADGWHTHAGTDVGVATTTTKGTVILGEFANDSANPTVPTRDHVYYTGTVWGYWSGGASPTFNAGLIAPPSVSNGMSEACLAWRVYNVNEQIAAVEVILADGGAASTNWQVDFYRMTETQYKSNDFVNATLIHSAMFTSGSTANNPVVYYSQLTPAFTSMLAGDIIAVKIINGSGKAPMTVRLMAMRAF